MDLPKKIGLIGVGYVGLPLASAMARRFHVTAYDIDQTRIRELKEGIDRTSQVGSQEFSSNSLQFTHNSQDLEGCTFYIVTVPTPVDDFNIPDLRPLYSACDTLSKFLKKGATVVFESTVYPGLTEEVLGPRIERVSGLRLNSDFFLGYSPERVNPGDRERTITTIQKIVSGSTPETADLVAAVYGSVIEAGVHRTKNIRTAEAAKIIENIQRDVNIGLVNELSVLFDRMDLDIYEVLEAASTKWNFLKFRPGLVGGHCIGVDPFYLTHKAQQFGYHPEMILAGRRINDSMGHHYATKCIQEMLRRKVSPLGAKVLVLGFTFKENCPDVRNTKVRDLVAELKKLGVEVDVVDPVADASAARDEYGVEVISEISGGRYSAVVLAVVHEKLMAEMPRVFESSLEPGGFVLDIKGAFRASDRVIH